MKNICWWKDVSIWQIIILCLSLWAIPPWWPMKTIATQGLKPGIPVSRLMLYPTGPLCISSVFMRSLSAGITEWSFFFQVETSFGTDFKPLQSASCVHVGCRDTNKMQICTCIILYDNSGWKICRDALPLLRAWEVLFTDFFLVEVNFLLRNIKVH